MLIIAAVSTPSLHNKEPALDWHASDYREFVPAETFGGPMVCVDNFVIQWLLPTHVPSATSAP